jgi:hypothetical protein
MVRDNRDNVLIERALSAIEKVTDNDKKLWLSILLGFLKNGEYATVTGKNGKLLDVTRIANTMYTASFFDVFNSIHKFDLNIKPFKTLTTKNTYGKFFSLENYGIVD